MAVWEQLDGVTVSIASNRYDAQSGSWGTAELIETGGGEAGRPQVSMDDSGNALAVWQQLDGVTVSIASNRYAPNAAWGTAPTAELIEGGACQAGNPQVAMGPSGNAVAVWTQCTQLNDPASNSIASNRFGFVRQWGVAQLIETGGGEASTPQVAMDGSGNALAVWTQASKSSGDIGIGRSWAGNGRFD